jgi:hypothetical protein
MIVLLIIHQNYFMPLYTTTIKLLSGTKEDYESLSNELKKKSFRAPEDKNIDEKISQDSPIRLSIFQSNLMDVTTSISKAASHTGKKFTFVVRKEKAL